MFGRVLPELGPGTPGSGDLEQVDLRPPPRSAHLALKTKFGSWSKHVDRRKQNDPDPYPVPGQDSPARGIGTVWPYRDLCNNQSPVLGLASCSRPAGQGPKLPPKLPQNWPQNCPVCVAMPARKGRGGGPPGHPSGAQEKLPTNCPITTQN